MQRHHLLPRQLVFQRSFAAMFTDLGKCITGFDDFRRNGVLLPASEMEAAKLGLPLHRGPHRGYNAMVSERIGQIEAGWFAQRFRSPVQARDDAAMRLRLLQGALRRRLLGASFRPFLLNRNDPLGSGVDFSGLDAMVDALWASTQLSIF